MIKQNRFWLRTLNVRMEEGWLVKQLFLLQFLQGAGIAFFFTASFALFLDRFEITELPYIFIYAAFLLWLSGFLYSRAERMLNSINLALATTIFMGVSILLFRVAWHYFDAPFFFYFMLAWFNVLYLLNNLEFWGLASLLFNTRQSKRLFSVISAGDIPAKFFGYSLALLFVEKIGTINLLFLGFGCMMLSVPFLLKIKRSGSIPMIHHHQKHSVPQGGIKKLVNNLTGNSLTRSLAALSIVITCSYLIINFAFYAGVKASYHSDVTLAKFIAFFLAMVRIVALVVKMIFTSRLINRFGNIRSLLVTPVVMTAMVLAIVSMQDVPQFPRIILYMFGATSIVVDILRSSINTPVFLTLMQPLPVHDRLRAHTIVKGIMDPFASLVTGFILIAVIELHVSAELLALCYVLLALAALWFASIFLVNRNYIRTVLKTISSRYFHNKNLLFDDANTLTYLREKVKTGTETEALNILGMISGSSAENQSEICSIALDHPSAEVRKLALSIVVAHNLNIPQDKIVGFLNDDDEEVRISAISAIKDQSNHHLIVPLLADAPVKLQSAAIGVLLKSEDAQFAETARSKLRELLHSPVPQRRAAAASLLFLNGESGFVENADRLMTDSSRIVREATFKGIVKSGDELLMQKMMQLFADYEKEITPALIDAGEGVLSYIREYINRPQATQTRTEKLVLVCGRIGGVKARIILLTLLSGNTKYSRTVIKALYRTGFSAKGSHALIITEKVKRLFEKCDVLCRMHLLIGANAKYDLLKNAFDIEFDQAREDLLYLFAMLYNREMINKVRNSYLSGQHERIINAMEIIDFTVRNDFARLFNHYFEPGPFKHALSQPYGNTSPVTAADVFEHIIADVKGVYNNWTKACAFYIAEKIPEFISEALVHKYFDADAAILRETAVAYKFSVRAISGLKTTNLERL